MAHSWFKSHGHDHAERVDRIQDAEFRTRGVVEIFRFPPNPNSANAHLYNLKGLLWKWCGLTFEPGRYRLEIVHHGAVEAEGPFRPDARWYEHEVEEAQVGLVVPFHGVSVDDFH